MLRRLELRDVGPADHLGVDFAPRVNLLTGGNGLGKSFLLDIAWWALTQTWARYPARPTTGQDVRPSIAATFDRSGKEISTTSRFDWEGQTWPCAPARAGDQCLILYAQVDGGFSVFDRARSNEAKTPERSAALQFTAQQVWDGLSRGNSRDPSRIAWLCQGLIHDWAYWQKANGSAFQQLCSVLRALSPQAEDPLTPGALARISLDDVRDMPTLKTSYGKEVAIVHASAAVQRIAALAYLLVWSWQEHRMASRLRNQAPTSEIIFLIDDIEAHLHPAWQRRILRALMNVMNALVEADGVTVQIIAATQSPLLLASMEPVFDRDKDALWTLALVDDAKRGRSVALQQDEWHRRGDVSAWLQSSIFGLREARSVEAEEAMVAARTFMDRDQPEALRFHEIYDQLRQSMPGMDPFWVTWRAWAWRHGLLGEQRDIATTPSPVTLASSR